MNGLKLAFIVSILFALLAGYDIGRSTERAISREAIKASFELGMHFKDNNINAADLKE